MLPIPVPYDLCVGVPMPMSCLLTIFRRFQSREGHIRGLLHDSEHLADGSFAAVAVLLTIAPVPGPADQLTCVWWIKGGGGTTWSHSRHDLTRSIVTRCHASRGPWLIMHHGSTAVTHRRPNLATSQIWELQ